MYSFCYLPWATVHSELPSRAGSALNFSPSFGFLHHLVKEPFSFQATSVDSMRPQVLMKMNNCCFSLGAAHGGAQGCFQLNPQIPTSCCCGDHMRLRSEPWIPVLKAVLGLLSPMGHMCMACLPLAEKLVGH